MKQLFFSLFFLSIGSVQAQITEAQVDDVVERTRKAFNVPGIAVGIVKDGKLVLAKGYGIRNAKTQEKVDAQTLFAVASNTKAMTAAALGQLVDQKKLHWDDKVVQYLPNFKMYNAYVTAEFTIRDLLTHRSGLGLGAGDLMIWPDGHNFTRNDIVQNIQYLKPVSGFRAKYDYDNLLYIIAGEVVAKVSGQSWNAYVEQHLMTPLRMSRSATSWERVKDTTNCSVPHVPTENGLQVIPRYTNSIFDAAAGVYTSVEDWSHWVIAQLQEGTYGPLATETLFSKTTHQEMWKPQTLMPITGVAPYRCHFKAYGLGWQLTDINGHLQVSHTGGLDGMVTQTVLFPELQLGIIVFTNQQSGAAFTAISNTIKDAYLGLQHPDHVTTLQSDRATKEAQADQITAAIWRQVTENEQAKGYRPKKFMLGEYHDPWFGAVTISEGKNKILFTSHRSPRLTGTLHWVKNDHFAVKWFNRSMMADAHVYVKRNAEGKLIGFTMAPISPLTDFSYDFQDLEFTKVD